MDDKPLSEITPAEMILASGMVWKLLTDELCARDPNALKSLTANLDNMVKLLRSGNYEGVSGVLAVLAIFRTVLVADDPKALQAALQSFGKSRGGSNH